MADPPDASETSMDVSSSTQLEELDPAGLNENSMASTEDSRQSSEMINISTLMPELLVKIFEFLSIPDRLHFRFVPFKGPQFYTFLGEFYKESNGD
jgi:hypothetical protein